mgnify:CR=1 FL=1
MTIISGDTKYQEVAYEKEEYFEDDILKNNKMVFGSKSILIESKKKIGTQSLGGTIPDAFLFDFSDIKNPTFYIVEIELKTHDFFNHIFPQITKFFAFFKNINMKLELIEKIYTIFSSDENLKKELRKYIGEKDIHKYLTDIIENSQNILLIIDGEREELPEIMETYTDTWGKMVKLLYITKFKNSINETLFSIYPEFENIEYIPAVDLRKREGTIYTEDYHLEDINANIKEIYYSLKKRFLEQNEKLVFNPQKYYISIINKKNVIYIEFRKKKIRLIIMLPYEEIMQKANTCNVTKLSQGVQDFYNGPCAAVELDSMKKIDEIIEIAKPLIFNIEDNS